MQAQGATRRAGVGTTIPRRTGGRSRLLEALLTVAAVLLIVAVMSLMTQGVDVPASSEVVTQEAVAGAAVVHDDAGNMPATTGAGSAVVHDDAANMPATGTGAVVHDDAGNVR